MCWDRREERQGQVLDLSRVAIHFKGDMKMHKEAEEWFENVDKNLCKHMERKDSCEDCKEEKK